MQFTVWMLGWFRIVEQAHYYFALGHLQSRIWDGYSRQLQSVMQSSAVQRWWEIRRSVFSTEFREFVDTVSRSDGSVVSTAKMLEEFVYDEPAD